MAFNFQQAFIDSLVGHFAKGGLINVDVDDSSSSFFFRSSGLPTNVQQKLSSMQLSWKELQRYCREQQSKPDSCLWSIFGHNSCCSIVKAAACSRVLLSVAALFFYHPSASASPHLQQ